jgi:hypothetical protein
LIYIEAIRCRRREYSRLGCSPRCWFVDYLGVVDEAAIGERFRALALAAELDERQRRLWAVAEARSAARGWDPGDCTRAGDRRRHDP